MLTKNLVSKFILIYWPGKVSLSSCTERETIGLAEGAMTADADALWRELQHPWVFASVQQSAMLLVFMLPLDNEHICAGPGGTAFSRNI